MKNRLRRWRRRLARWLCPDMFQIGGLTAVYRDAVTGRLTLEFGYRDEPYNHCIMTVPTDDREPGVSVTFE